MSDAPKELPEIQCLFRKDLSIDESNGTTQLPPMTVGETYILDCEGEFGESEKPSVQIDIGEGEYSRYFLYPLKTLSLTPQKLSLEVTFYQVAELPPGTPITLTVNDQKYISKNLTWKVDSVLGDLKEVVGEPPKPFPLCGPIEIGFPWMFLFYTIALFLVVVGFVSFVVFRVNRRRRHFAEAKEFKTARSSYDEFYYQVRKLEKRNSVDDIDVQKFVEEIEVCFRRFLATEFEFPAHVWSQAKVLARLKSRERKIFNQLSDSLKRSFREFRALKVKNISREDCSDLSELCKDVVARIEKMRDKKGRL